MDYLQHAAARSTNCGWVTLLGSPRHCGTFVCGLEATHAGAEEKTVSLLEEATRGIQKQVYPSDIDVRAKFNQRV